MTQRAAGVRPRPVAPLVFAGAAGVALLALAALLAADRGSRGGATPLLVWNATASVPVGLYRVLPLAPGGPRAGDLVLARAPAGFVPLLAERGYLPRGVPLIKRVAAVAGQRVCWRAGVVSIDGRVAATALAADRSGRPLPRPEGCTTLGRDEVFLLNADVPASLDGRYFGPTPVTSVLARAVPLWTWDDDGGAALAATVPPIPATSREARASRPSRDASAHAREKAVAATRRAFPPSPAVHGSGRCQCVP